MLFLIFLSLPVIHKLPRCDDGYVSVAGNCIPFYDLLSILAGMIKERTDYVKVVPSSPDGISSWTGTPEGMESKPCSSDKRDSLHTIINANETHRFDHYSCQWEIRDSRNATTTPFGYDPASGSGCLPEYYWNGTGCPLRENEN